MRSVTFSYDGGIAIDYMESLRDLRENGLVLNHAIHIPGEDQYDDEIEAVRDAVLYLLADALDDFEAMPPVTDFVPELEPDDDEDDDE